MSNTLELGDLCAFCGRDTVLWRGLFVDRIPAYTDIENVKQWRSVSDEYVYANGWLCRECLEDG